MDTEREQSEASISAYETDGEASVASANDAILPRRRQATVYDAVAGNWVYPRSLSTPLLTPPPTGKVKINERFTDGKQRERSHSPIIKNPTRDAPLAPDEVLFRRRAAPQRYAEHDIYFSHRHDLPQGGRGVLPDSDLLKAVHAYSSAYYAAHRRTEGGEGGEGGEDVDERSMDETALLAFGILLEEAGREVLGKRGDLVFTEPAQPEDNADELAESAAGILIGHQTSGTEIPHRKKRVKAENETVNG